MEEMTPATGLLYTHTHTHSILTLTEHHPVTAGWSVLSRCVTQIVAAVDDI